MHRQGLRARAVDLVGPGFTFQGCSQLLVCLGSDFTSLAFFIVLKMGVLIHDSWGSYEAYWRWSR